MVDKEVGGNKETAPVNTRSGGHNLLLTYFCFFQGLSQRRF